ncbi:MAG: ACP S-malonyltransferase [Candidatus Saganbacteria bacterium]|nr:ACP S-malonyltransferase [Candidatus Saganbacteria bacterium]
MSIAFVFPGQGSQVVGMGKDLFENIPLAKELFEKADAALGFPLSKLCFEGPEEELKKTAITQPAILAVSTILGKLLLNAGKKPEIVAGHSLGEYSALVIAGAIDFEDAIKVVHLRGKFMQDAVPLGKGAMSAVLGADREKLVAICREVSASSGFVQAANFNSPDQIVISGEKGAVELAGVKLKEAGAKKIIPLAVSAPFHSALMQPAQEKLAEELNKINIKDAGIPVISNVTAKPIQNAAEIKKLLIEQVTHSVLWVDSVQEMVKLGVSEIVEVGSGKVLAGLIKKISSGIAIYNVSDANSLKERLES